MHDSQIGLEEFSNWLKIRLILVHFCLFQADSLKKSLKGSGNGCSLDSKMQQVKELEDEVSFHISCKKAPLPNNPFFADGQC